MNESVNGKEEKGRGKTRARKKKEKRKREIRRNGRLGEEKNVND